MTLKAEMLDIEIILLLPKGGKFKWRGKEERHLGTIGTWKSSLFFIQDKNNFVAVFFEDTSHNYIILKVNSHFLFSF